MENWRVADGVRWEALAESGMNCRSLHGTPGQVGFARDDKV